MTFTLSTKFLYRDVFEPIFTNLAKMSYFYCDKEFARFSMRRIDGSTYHGGVTRPPRQTYPPVSVRAHACGGIAEVARTAAAEGASRRQQVGRGGRHDDEVGGLRQGGIDAVTVAHRATLR